MIQWNTDTKEFKDLSEHVKMMKDKIKKTQLDVSNDVFQKINSQGSMGVIGHDGKMQIDLHALHLRGYNWQPWCNDLVFTILLI
jgi:hypothetical protein